MKKLTIFLVLFLLVATLAAVSMTFVVNEGEYVVLKQFGKVVDIYEEPGLKFKIPLFQTVETLPNKELIYDLPISEVITKDKQTMVADSFALWRISDPKKFIANLNGSITNAESRIEVLVYNAMKNEISSRTQAEVIGDRTGKLASDITSVAKPNFEQYGIELLAVETKHLDLPHDNKESVFNRMISERANISAAYTAEGEKFEYDFFAFSVSEQFHCDCHRGIGIFFHNSGRFFFNRHHLRCMNDLHPLKRDLMLGGTGSEFFLITRQND